MAAILHEENVLACVFQICGVLKEVDLIAGALRVV
jgi:hypothetical protein